MSEQTESQCAAEWERWGRKWIAHHLSLRPGRGGDDFQRVESLCVDVLERMPRDAAYKLLVSRPTHVFWFPAGCSLADTWPASDDGRINAILLAANLPCRDDDEARGTIAHEYAHLACGHTEERSGRSREADERWEKEANAKAKEWGFEKEIEAMKARDEALKRGRT